MITLSLIFVYTYAPIQDKQESVLLPDTYEKLIQQIEAITDKSQEGNLQKIRDNIFLMTNIVSAVMKDNIACIIPDKSVMKKLDQTSTVIIAESGAFTMPTKKGSIMGDAIVGTKSKVQQQNPLLKIMHNKQQLIEQLLYRIELHMDHSGDRFKERFNRKSSELLTKLQQSKSDLIQACAEQRSRLSQSHPYLSNYNFVDESTHGKTAVPRYVFGDAMKPVLKEPIGQTRLSPLGLMHEFYSV